MIWWSPLQRSFKGHMFLPRFHCQCFHDCGFQLRKVSTKSGIARPGKGQSSESAFPSVHRPPGARRTEMKSRLLPLMWRNNSWLIRLKCHFVLLEKRDLMGHTLLSQPAKVFRTFLIIVKTAASFMLAQESCTFMLSDSELCDSFLALGIIHPFRGKENQCYCWNLQFLLPVVITFQVFIFSYWDSL